VVRKVTTGFQS